MKKRAPKKIPLFMVNTALFDGLEEEYEEKWQCLAEDSTLDPRSIAVAKALYDQEMSFRKWLVKNGSFTARYGKFSESPSAKKPSTES